MPMDPKRGEQLADRHAIASGENERQQLIPVQPIQCARSLHARLMTRFNKALLPSPERRAYRHSPDSSSRGFSLGSVSVHSVSCCTLSASLSLLLSSPVTQPSLAIVCLFSVPRPPIFFFPSL